MKNFAKLKDSIYAESINCLQEDRPRSKKLIKGYVAILKSNPTLKEAFHIHNNLERGTFKNEDVKHGFIVENLTAIKQLDKNELYRGLQDLDKFFKSNNITVSTDLNVLSEKISNLMVNVHRIDKSVENNEAVEYIIESVLNREPSENKRKPVSHKILKETASKKYNEKFASLTEDEKKIIKGFFTGNKDVIKKQYDELISEVKGRVDTKISDTDDKDLKLKFYEVKDKLITPTEDITLEHFKKILKLKESL
jgi:hypothetical protein